MKYDTGTVQTTNGSANIVGTGTKWAANIVAGQFFTIIGSNVFYTVATVTDDTHIALSANYAGASLSGQSYDIHQSFTTNYSIPYPQQGDIQVAAILARALSMIDSELLKSKNVYWDAASQAAMLALAAKSGDMARRSDLTQTFFLTTNSPSTLADWKRIA